MDKKRDRDRSISDLDSPDTSHPAQKTPRLSPSHTAPSVPPNPNTSSVNSNLNQQSQRHAVPMDTDPRDDHDHTQQHVTDRQEEQDDGEREPEQDQQQQSDGRDEQEQDTLPSADPSIPPDPEDDPLVKFQRAQLAARIHDQNRVMLWLREKVNELQNLVAVLDAAPRAALYHMCAVREDLTLTLARLGLSSYTDDPSECPIAATLLDAEIVTNDSLAEMPAALKKLTAQIILAREKESQSQRPENEKTAGNKLSTSLKSDNNDPDDPDADPDKDGTRNDQGKDGKGDKEISSTEDVKMEDGSADTKKEADDGGRDDVKAEDKEHDDDDGGGGGDVKKTNKENSLVRLKKLKEANDELHRRLRVVSDQLERYAERDKQSLVSSTTLKDEYDDLAEEASIQRRKIVSLKTKIKERTEQLGRMGTDDERGMRDDAKSCLRASENGPKRSSDSLSHGGAGGGGMSLFGMGGGAVGGSSTGGVGGSKTGTAGGTSGSGGGLGASSDGAGAGASGDGGMGGATGGSGVASGGGGGAMSSITNGVGGSASGGVSGGTHLLSGNTSTSLNTLRELTEKRLEELHESHAEAKRLALELEGVRADIARRDANVVPIKTILNTALYQTMEATLQQLYMKEKHWQAERDARNESLDAERKDAAEKLEQANATAEKKIEDLHRQLEEVRRIADAAKIEKDKVMMTYEARKMETGNAAAVIAAAEKRANVSDEMREKLVKENKSLTSELESLREHVREFEKRVKDSSSDESKAVIERLQKAMEDERAKSNSFIQEVESLSNMFGEVESENKRLVKQLGEKDAMLSKVMAERLRGRQLLTTIKEENRALTQGRELDASKMKQLSVAVAASKKVAGEANVALNKGQEEVRVLSSTLEKRRRIAEDATKNLRSVSAEKDEMKRERDAFQSRAEAAVAQGREDAFEAKRWREKVRDLEENLSEARQRLEQQEIELANGRRSGEDELLKDGIIGEMRKRLHCSVVTSEEKAVVLLRCGHLFSRKCTDDLIATRNRKCPICGKPFGNDDVRPVFF